MRFQLIFDILDSLYSCALPFFSKVCGKVAPGLSMPFPDPQGLCILSAPSPFVAHIDPYFVIEPPYTLGLKMTFFAPIFARRWDTPLKCLLRSLELFCCLRYYADGYLEFCFTVQYFTQQLLKSFERFSRHFSGFSY